MVYKIYGGEVIINKGDLKLISQYKWHVGTDGYARASLNHKDKLYMHELLVGKAPKGLVTDHKNRQKLDNRRRNLRFITKSENMKNSEWYESGELHKQAEERMNRMWSILRSKGLNKLSLLDWKLQAMGV